MAMLLLFLKFDKTRETNPVCLYKIIFLKSFDKHQNIQTDIKIVYKRFCKPIKTQKKKKTKGLQRRVSLEQHFENEMNFAVHYSPKFFICLYSYPPDFSASLANENLALAKFRSDEMLFNP